MRESESARAVLVGEEGRVHVFEGLSLYKRGQEGDPPCLSPSLSRSRARSLTHASRARSLAPSLSRSLTFRLSLSLSWSVWRQDHFNDILSNSGAMATAAAASKFPQLWSLSLSLNIDACMHIQCVHTYLLSRELASQREHCRETYCAYTHTCTHMHT